MIEIKTEFSQRELSWFGPLFCLFIGIITGIGLRHGVPVWIGAIVALLTTLLVVAYYVRTDWQPPIFRGWLLSVAPIGWIISHLLMAVVFYGVVTPIGCVMRAAGHDPLLRRKAAQRTTYWQARRPPRDAADYYRQF